MALLAALNQWTAGAGFGGNALFPPSASPGTETSRTGEGWGGSDQNNGADSNPPSFGAALSSATQDFQSQAKHDDSAHDNSTGAPASQPATPVRATKLPSAKPADASKASGASNASTTSGASGEGENPPSSTPPAQTNADDTQAAQAPNGTASATPKSSVQDGRTVDSSYAGASILIIPGGIAPAPTAKVQGGVSPSENAPSGAGQRLGAVPFDQTIVRIAPPRLTAQPAPDQAVTASSDAGETPSPKASQNSAAAKDSPAAQQTVPPPQASDTQQNSFASAVHKALIKGTDNAAAQSQSDSKTGNLDPSQPAAGAATAQVLISVAGNAGGDARTAASAAAPKSDAPSASPVTGILSDGASAPQQGAGAESASKAQDSPAPSAQETYDQIVLGLKAQMDPKSGKAQILLDPPNMGSVKVSLSLANGALTAQFESSTGAVRDLLKSNLDKLQTVLQGQGIAVDRLAVSAPPAGQAMGNSGGQAQQDASGSPAHDGRSAGGFTQDSRSGQQRWENGAGNFARVFAQSQDAPIDVVA